MIQWDLNVNRKTPITNMFKFIGPKPGKVVRISGAVYNRPGNKATLGPLRTYFYYCRIVGLIPVIP